jgi:hypothetical protein
MKMTAFWATVPCSPTEVEKHFRGHTASIIRTMEAIRTSDVRTRHSIDRQNTKLMAEIKFLRKCAGHTFQDQVSIPLFSMS